MSNTVISVENLSKSYQLGAINTGTFYGDLNRWWAKLRNLPDPHLKIGEVDHGNRQGEILWALKDVNFQVQQGETLGIIGRNGAGKSTLLKILSRVTAPTSGEVKVKGRIASLLEVGTGFHPELTGRENVYLNGAIMGMNKAEINRKFDEIVDFSGVEQFIDTPVKRYSSGMYVRLAFAVAAHLDPEILIVDEVLAVGDAEFQKKCLGKMGNVAHEGRTVLFVSHNMAAVQTLCQHGIFLQQGRICFQGTQTETINKYIDSMTKDNALINDYNHRPGTGKIRIVEISFRDSSGLPIKAVQSGQNVNICLGFITGKNYSGGSARVGIVVSTQPGIQIFSHSSVIQGIDFDHLPEQGSFICRIPRLPLPMSNYKISASIKVDGTYSDVIENGMDLEVIQGDFFRTGFYPSSTVGVCFVDAEWALE